MGNSKSQNTAALKIDYQQWKQIGYQEGLKIVASTRGQGQGQQQIVVIDPKSDIEKEYKIYSYRKNQDKALVKVHGVQYFEKKSIGMCGSEDTMKVITQRIKYRWSQLPQLTVPECLYALNQSLKGYRDCYEEIGSFDVNQNMIAINQNGQLKVWVNQNFAVNHPSFEKPFLYTSGQNKYGQLIGGNRDEQDMVKNVIDVIEERCEQGRYPPELRNRLHMCQTFLTAQTQVEQFAEKYHIWVPDRIRPQVIVTNQTVNKNQISQQKQAISNLNYGLTHANEIPIQSQTSVRFNSQPPQIFQNVNYRTNQPQNQFKNPLRSMGYEVVNRDHIHYRDHRDQYYSPSVPNQSINPSFATNQIKQTYVVSDNRNANVGLNSNAMISGYQPYIPPVSMARTQHHVRGVKFNYNSPSQAANNIQVSQVKPFFQMH